MENNEIKEPLVIGDVVRLTTKQKVAILNEAMFGIKSLSTILEENSITEREFYIWKEKYLAAYN